MSARELKIARVRPRNHEPATEPAPDTAAAHLGSIVAALPDGRVSVAVPGRPEPVSARLALAIDGERLQRVIASGQQAVVIYEAQATQRALVIGLIETAEPAAPSVAPAHAAARVVEADVDGKRVRVVGQDEIVLECGQASITLRRNGRVVIRGTYVESYSEGTNRIKGGQVRIN